MFEKITQDIAQTYYQQHFPNDGQRFVAWYVRNIHGQDANQAVYCITDGADDKQIDAVVINDEAQAVYVIQGKFIATQAVDAAPLREVLSSWVQLKDLAALQQNANSRLKQRLIAQAETIELGYEIAAEATGWVHALRQVGQVGIFVFQQADEVGERHFGVAA